MKKVTILNLDENLEYKEDAKNFIADLCGMLDLFLENSLNLIFKCSKDNWGKLSWVKTERKRFTIDFNMNNVSEAYISLLDMTHLPEEEDEFDEDSYFISETYSFSELSLEAICMVINTFIEMEDISDIYQWIE